MRRFDLAGRARATDFFAFDLRLDFNLGLGRVLACGRLGLPAAFREAPAAFLGFAGGLRRAAAPRFAAARGTAAAAGAAGAPRS